MVKFHQTLSERSVYMRCFLILPLRNRVAHERLTRICFTDHDRDIAVSVSMWGTFPLTVTSWVTWPMLIGRSTGRV